VRPTNITVIAAVYSRTPRVAERRHHAGPAAARVAGFPTTARGGSQLTSVLNDASSTIDTEATAGSMIQGERIGLSNHGHPSEMASTTTKPAMKWRTAMRRATSAATSHSATPPTTSMPSDRSTDGVPP
jgi:hypothetical protein